MVYTTEKENRRTSSRLGSYGSYSNEWIFKSSRRDRLSARRRRWASSCSRWVPAPGGPEDAEGTDHPDRNAQFEFINDRFQAYHARNAPVISVDTQEEATRRRVQERGLRVATDRRADPFRGSRLLVTRRSTR